MSKAKTGSDWTYKIYFYPRADKYDGGPAVPISDEELIEKLSTQVDVDEDIVKVYVYKSALVTFQLTKAILCHMFVVFETVDWWWSIEKNAQGITLQRSTSRNDVKKKYRQEDRIQHTSIELVEKDRGRKNMRQLIEMLWKENELNHRYGFLDSNCKDFAKVVFDYAARSKTLEFVI